MRHQLNNNPLAQLAVVGVLLLGVGFFLMSSMGGGEDESGESSSSSISLAITAPGEALSEPGAGGGAVPALAEAAAPPLPRPVVAAWKANKTVVLLFVRDGGIDDRLVRRTTESLAGFPRVESFIVPAERIARYGQVTEGLGIGRVPALVVIRPRHLAPRVPTATVHYGFQSRASVRQAIIDAAYRGRSLDYHP